MNDNTPTPYYPEIEAGENCGTCGASFNMKVEGGYQNNFDWMSRQISMFRKFHKCAEWTRPKEEEENS